MPDSTLHQAIDAAHARHAEYLNGFKALLRIPSVSTDPAYAAEVKRCADWLAAELTRIGFANARAYPTDGHPVVYGEWLDAGPDAPTVLVYAHYDVQPVDPLDLWDSPPFEPEVRDGRLYARGAIDDKAGVWVNLKAFESMFAAHGALPVNVKLFFEGEEESGSPSMEAFIRAHTDLLAADLLVLSDGGFPPEQPQIYYGVRGIIDADVIVSGPVKDIHSGRFGGAVHNPAHMVAAIIASLHDAEGRITLPGFYDDVLPLDDAERAHMDVLEQELLADTAHYIAGKQPWASSLGTLAERTTALPSLDINGIWGGYQGPGSKTIIPAEAGFKVSVRLVKNQNPYTIMDALIAHVESFQTDTLDIRIQPGPLSWPALLLTAGPAVDALQAAYRATWGKAAQLVRTGGSVPIMGMFQQALDIPITALSVGIGDNIHAPNEFFTLDYFYRGIDTALHFYYGLAAGV